ncbi:hypothetical protein FPV67DRAFT_1620392 [Lyophyllum atratum]|nr:hypothetical protein FPV67DRAFT_1620392 [Lyophyllum atratum]
MPPKSTATPPAANTASKDQYHHFIPRFILRRYHVAAANIPQQKRRKYKTFEERAAETVLVFDIPSLTLSNQSLNNVYGVQNLYRDVSAQDVNELEKALSVLENHAARVINNLHVHTEDDFLLNRKDLYHLRKFLFIMHYRQSKLSSTYFQEDHPENRPLIPWLKNFRRKHGLKTSADMWLFTIRYYIETSHSVICKQADEMYQKYGRDVVNRLAIDPEMEYYYALAYATQAQEYFLGFWEAPEGTEFILGQNGFGLWEGNSFPLSKMHRLFVVSPRFAVVLRQKKMLPGNLRNQPFLNTDFKDIKQEPARITLAAQGKESDADLFAFRITRLTKAQMQAFNSVVLCNVRVDGAITFTSKEYVLGVLREHCASREYSSDRARYQPLIEVLSSPAPSPPLHPEAGGSHSVESDGDPDTQFRRMLGRIDDGSFTFLSRYDQAHHLLSMCDMDIQQGNPFFSEIRRVSVQVIERFTEILREPARGFAPRPHAQLVEHMSAEQSTLLFGWMKGLVGMLGLQTKTNAANGYVSMSDVVILRFLRWIVQNRHDTLSILLPIDIMS